MQPCQTSEWGVSCPRRLLWYCGGITLFSCVALGNLSSTNVLQVLLIFLSMTLGYICLCPLEGAPCPVQSHSCSLPKVEPTTELVQIPLYDQSVIPIYVPSLRRLSPDGLLSYRPTEVNESPVSPSPFQSVQLFALAHPESLSKGSQTDLSACASVCSCALLSEPTSYNRISCNDKRVPLRGDLLLLKLRSKALTPNASMKMNSGVTPAHISR
jgi:hypothetical protein